jgi:hypothetical protein
MTRIQSLTLQDAVINWDCMTNQKNPKVLFHNPSITQASSPFANISDMCTCNYTDLNIGADLSAHPLHFVTTPA